MLLGDRKFIAVAAAGAVAFVAIGVSLPKIWVVTPNGFTPVVKISLLDQLQARTLVKTAKRLGAEGRKKEATVAWLGALGNHPANPETLRSFVEFALNTEGLDRRWLLTGAQQAQWLVRLAGTNSPSTLELAGRMCARAGLDEQAWSYLGTPNQTMSVAAARAMADVAFKTGRLKEFVEVWEKRRADLTGDPTLVLYGSAWLAVSGPPSEQRSHMEILNQATSDPAMAATAFRLRSMVESQRLDVDAFKRSFEELRNLRQDGLEDHIRFWLVLEASGAHTAAAAQATAYAIPPETGDQAKQLLTAWSRLRLDHLALGFAKNQLDAFLGDPFVWFITTQMLINLREWDEVRSVALRLRKNPALSGYFAGYLDFLEGVADSGYGRDQRARQWFATMLKTLPAEPILGLEISATLERLGYWAESRAVLMSLESTFGSKADYWYSMGRLAWQDRNSAELLKAAEKAHALDRQNPQYRSLLAAALLIARVRPAEALEFTLEAIKESSGQPAAVINHAFALVRLGRAAEARKVMNELPLSSVTDEEQTFWRMAMLEIALAEGDFQSAKTHIRGIDSRYLYDNQREWVDERMKELDEPRP